MTDVHLQHLNYAQIKVCADVGIIYELADYLEFFAPNYKFHPKFKAKVWNGRISLLNRMTCICYAGLAQRIKKFCDARKYTMSFDDELYYENVSRKQLEDHIKSLDIPDKFESRDYQFESILKCLKSNRRTLISPTSSGKSFMIYVTAQWYKSKKKLIIVPTVGLVSQFESDLRDYGFKGDIHTSINGLSKSDDIDCEYCITTWQSLDNGKNRMHKSWYEQFEVVFGDEAHGAKAATLISILTNLVNCKYRFGTTGTLDDDPLNEATIEGLFGPQYRSISTAEMIEQGYAPKFKVKCIVLKHPKDTCEIFRKKKPDKNKPGKLYKEEVDFLTNCESRNNFIKNLMLSLKGNKLLFFKEIDHGILLKELLEDEMKIFHIDGSVKSDRREEIRKAIENEDDCGLVASMGTTSTGISVKKLKHMIAASSSKGKIKVLQSIGRMLREHDDYDEVILYDIVDDMSVGSYKNYTLNHFIERTSIYDKEQFPYTIYNVKL